MRTSSYPQRPSLQLNHYFKISCAGTAPQGVVAQEILKGPFILVYNNRCPAVERESARVQQVLLGTKCCPSDPRQISRYYQADPWTDARVTCLNAFFDAVCSAMYGVKCMLLLMAALWCFSGLEAPSASDTFDALFDGLRSA